MTRIKICGMTSVDDALMAVDGGIYRRLYELQQLEDPEVEA